MNREGWSLTTQQWGEWIDLLAKAGKRIIAPAIENETLRLFKTLKRDFAVSFENYENTRWSPKEFMFPNTETLFSFQYVGEEIGLQGPASDTQEQVIFGVRPCDAAGLSRLDDIFLNGDDNDPFYADRKRRTTIVSLACATSMPQCFCTAVGGSSSGTDGSDLQLAQIGDQWILSVLTNKGRELAAEYSDRWETASDADWAAADQLRLTVDQQIKKNVVPLEWASDLEKTFGDAVWQKLGENCLSCGICAYVCPSCSCFDVFDEGDTTCGTRCRSWDSCTFAGFTAHASGHNPRENQSSRYRQRVMHKFSYFPLQQGNSQMCVGCGRCTALCPVGIDIHSSVNAAVAAGATADGAS